MTLGERIDRRREALGISQAELARRVGIRQSTMNSLIRGDSRSSRSIVQIAHELGTTPAYLTGKTDDPDENAPPPPAAPTIQHIMMPVALPAESALARMFEALLRVMPSGAGLEEQAELLAKRLPIGLAQLRDLLPPEPVQPVQAEPALAEAIATHDRGPRS